MPRYFFHIWEADKRIEDPDGSELPDLQAALAEALDSARAILSEKVRLGKVVNGNLFEIADATGKVLATLPFKEALRLD